MPITLEISQDMLNRLMQGKHRRTELSDDKLFDKSTLGNPGSSP